MALLEQFTQLAGATALLTLLIGFIAYKLVSALAGLLVRACIALIEIISMYLCYKIFIILYTMRELSVISRAWGRPKDLIRGREPQAPQPQVQEA